jgi:hypothetical protein
VIADVRTRLAGRTSGTDVGRAAATAGIALGIFAFWLALPPWTVRDLAFPVAAGFLGAGAAVAALAAALNR